jgi:hypothetical protein
VRAADRSDHGVRHHDGSGSDRDRRSAADHGGGVIDDAVIAEPDVADERRGCRDTGRPWDGRREAGPLEEHGVMLAHRAWRCPPARIPSREVRAGNMAHAARIRCARKAAPRAAPMGDPGREPGTSSLSEMTRVRTSVRGRTRKGTMCLQIRWRRSSACGAAMRRTNELMYPRFVPAARLAVETAPRVRW